MKITGIFILFGLLLTMMSCQKHDMAIFLISKIEDEAYSIEKGIDLKDFSDYDSQIENLRNMFLQNEISLQKTYTINLSGEAYGYMYVLDDVKSAEKLYDELDIKAYTAFNVWFIYQIDHIVIEMTHSTDSSFPDVFDDLNFKGNYNYQLYYEHSMTRHPIFDEFIDVGSTINDIESMSEIKWNHLINESDIDYQPIEIEFSDEFDSFSGYALTLSNEREAHIVYYNLPVSFNMPSSSGYLVLIKYQNLVFRFSSTYNDYLPSIFQGKEIEVISMSSLDFWYDNND